jgi:lysophospholipase L1-like esterase
MNRQEEQRGVIFGKTARAILVFAGLATLSSLVPGLAHYRLLSSGTLMGLIRGPGEVSSPLSGGAAVAAAGAADRLERIVAGVKAGEIEDPSGHALDGFFAALLRTEIEGGRTRVCHFGDSPITNDGITSTLRRRLQLRFGDAGHGFVLIARPWAWYSHSGVVHEASRGWSIDPMFISRKDHLYGLGGVSFSARAEGVSASFGTAVDGEVGRSASSFEVYYLAQPGGGDFYVDIDGEQKAQVQTAGDRIESGFYRTTVDEGPHVMTLRTSGNGEVRLFGVVLESGSRGVEYDSLGVNGAFIGLLAHYIDEEHWTRQLRHRDPQLVIINYGTNESQFERLPMDQYERDTREVIRRVREAQPAAALLFIGPMDRGKREDGRIVTRPMIPRLIDYQRRIAADTECGFFDVFTAMGGEGTVAQWVEARPRLMGGDYTHPTAQGAEIVGTLIYEALMRAYDDYKKRIGVEQPDRP